MAKVSINWKTGNASGGFKSKVAVDIETMYTAGVWLSVQLVNRTQSGRDEDGRKFVPYTAAYAKQKNVARTAVDLTRSGDMLNDFGVLWAARNRVRIGFASSRMAKRALYNEQMNRFFLGIPPAWLREVKRRVAKGITFYS